MRSGDVMDECELINLQRSGQNLRLLTNQLLFLKTTTPTFLNLNRAAAASTVNIHGHTNVAAAERRETGRPSLSMMKLQDDATWRKPSLVLVNENRFLNERRLFEVQLCKSSF